MSHTPGPWEVRNHPDFGNLLVVVSPDYRKTCDANHVVCELRPWQRPDPDPNARLIAAAPELLRELKRLLAMWEEAIGYEPDYMDMGDAARAAINKAEGRGE